MFGPGRARTASELGNKPAEVGNILRHGEHGVA
jgi:hypothetical protein